MPLSETDHAHLATIQAAIIAFVRARTNTPSTATARARAVIIQAEIIVFKANRNIILPHAEIFSSIGSRPPNFVNY